MPSDQIPSPSPENPVPPEPPPPTAPTPAGHTDDRTAKPVADWRVKSFDFAADAIKQLITVATGVITLAVIFSKEFGVSGRGLAVTAWIFLIFSVVAGIIALLGLVGQITNNQDGPDPPTLSAERSIIRPAAAVQVVLFLIGMGVLMAFGFYATPAKSQDGKTPINCIVQPAPPQVIKVEIPSPPPPPTPPHHRRPVKRCCCCPAKPTTP